MHRLVCPDDRASHNGRAGSHACEKGGQVHDVRRQQNTSPFLRMWKKGRSFAARPSPGTYKTREAGPLTVLGRATVRCCLRPHSTAGMVPKGESECNRASLFLAVRHCCASDAASLLDPFEEPTQCRSNSWTLERVKKQFRAARAAATSSSRGENRTLATPKVVKHFVHLLSAPGATYGKNMPIVIQRWCLSNR